MRLKSILAAGALVLAGCDEAPPPEKPVRPVMSMVVGEAEAFRRDSLPGRAKATQEINLSFEVTGRIVEFPVRVGDEVKKGDVLAGLDSARFNTEVNRLSGELVSALGMVDAAEKQVARGKELVPKGFMPQALLDEAIARAQSARGAAAALNAAIEKAKRDFNDTVVVAPFDGTISETFVENFQNVIAKQPILRLLDTSQIEMEVSIPEQNISLAPYVQEIIVRFSALPDVEVKATIKEISNEASITTRTYPVTIIMDQPEGAEIKPGMSGEATAVLALPENFGERGIEVPASTLFSPDDGTADQVFVWIVDEASTTVERRQVDVVATAARGVLVTGVEPGERIVTAGVNYLTDGQKVRLITE